MSEFRILPRTLGVLYQGDGFTVQTYTGGLRKEVLTAGTVFFSVLEGHPRVNGHLLRPGMYGCVPRLVEFSCQEACRVAMIDDHAYPGIFMIGGPIEPVGRLRYMDGCTDTGIIAPLRLGDPCLNFLFFPPETKQTRHTHPSDRIGAIFDGDGVCITPGKTTRMSQGDVFVIPTDAEHHFETTSEHMRIIVFHPDSEFGPTDERHQMLEATIMA